MAHVILATERLYVRPWQEGDLEPLYAIFSDPRVVRFTEGRPWSREQVLELVRWGIDNRVGYEPGFFNCPLVLRDGARVIGRVGINPLWDGAGHTDPNEPELEWTIAAQHWGRGLATEVGRAMIAYGFDVTGFDHMIAFAHPEHAASLRVMEKIGMRRDRQAAFRGEEWTFYRIERQQWVVTQGRGAADLPECG